MFGTTPLSFCGCYIWIPAEYKRRYLPQTQLESHTTILGVTSRTVLKQTFVNDTNEALKQVSYTFPLYDGVSISEFTCTVGGRVIKGIVKERTEAKADYDKAISQGQTAGLLEQSQDAGDVFTTSIGNVAAGESMVVEITYLGELKNDAETDGSRFTIPTAIAPRYGNTQTTSSTKAPQTTGGSISITVDVKLETGNAIRGIQSSSHPIAVTMGRLSTDAEDDDVFENHQGSATLTLGSAELDKDFVVVVSAKGQDTPRALLETHPTLPNQMALMTTLVPKFSLPPERPEIIFVVDRSGSMEGKMHLVVEAMKVFLKSLPVGVKFNIYSFGSNFSSLFPKSKTYDAQSLEVAMKHISDGTFQANYGGTEMMEPIKDVLKKRYKDLSLEVMLLTDGEIWNQDALFEVVNTANKNNARFFTLGVGYGASSSLIEGIARAGRGFSQWVNDGERIDKKLVRMLKGAMTPHIDYRLELVYAKDSTDEDDFEMVESFEKSMKLVADKVVAASPPKKKISLFSKNKEPSPDPKGGRYDHLPTTTTPSVLQIPYRIPDLYPHSRASVYLLLSPDGPTRKLSSVWLKGSSNHGDLELEIPVEDVGQGDTIHKLAAKKAMQDLEEGRGWLDEAKSSAGKTLKSVHEGKWDLMVEREAVRLGTSFQVGGKFCSFVAIDESKGSPESMDTSNPALQDYQMGLMKLEQTNRNRFMMKPQMMSMSRSAAPMSKMKRSAAALPPPGAATATFGRGGLFGGPSGGAAQYSTQSAAPPTGSSDRRERKKSASPSMASPAPPPAPQAFGMAWNANTPSPRSFGAPAPAAFQQQSAFGSMRRQEEEESEPMDFAMADEGALDNFDMNSFVNAPKADKSMESSGAPNLSDKSNALDLMRKLIDLQTFSGSWQANRELISILKPGATNVNNLNKPEDVVQLVKSKTAMAVNDEIAATICAIAWLETRVPDERDVWEMVVDKARDWLLSAAKDSSAMDSAIEAVKAECQWKA